MKITVLKTFSESLKKVMQEKNMAAKDLAQKSAISYSTLTPIINGQRDCGITKLVAIANALNCSADVLLPNLLPNHGGNNATSAATLKNIAQPQYLAVLVAQTSVIHCLIHEIKSNRQQTLILPYDFAHEQNANNFIDIIFNLLYETISKNFLATPASKNIAVFISVQQYEGINNREKIQQTGDGLFAKFILEPDILTNYYSLLGKQNGICVTINNGSTILYSIDHGKSFIKKQGYGFPITDTAGNEWIGCEAIRHVINVKEQTAPSTLLSDKILALFSDDLNIIAENTLLWPAKTYKKVSPIVKELMHIEPIAYAIIEKSAHLLLQKINLIDQTTPTPLPIVLAGDLAENYKEFFPQERLIALPQKLSTALLACGLDSLKKAI